jgi:hypothetical protein
MKTANELHEILTQAANQVARLPTNEVFKVFSVLIAGTLIAILKELEDRNKMLADHVAKNPPASPSVPSDDMDLDDIFTDD